MGILSADNNTSYTANDNCKIYIIKQIDPYDQDTFEQNYSELLSKDNNSLINKIDNFNILDNNQIKLTPLMFNNINSSQYIEGKYTNIEINSNEESKIYDPDNNTFYHISGVWFLTDLLELRGCPLIDFTKLAYVFQIEGQSKAGIPNVTGFNCSFSVNGQSSCDLILNNQDYKFNFKYFNDREKYLKHLKCYFDTNDIIIVRMQKKNTTPTSLLNSFKKSSILNYQDNYKASENDPLTTVFTGYINDINESFSYENGTQNLEIHCTGPSKKLTWTRVLQNNALASKDSGAAIIPINAYVTGATTSGSNGTYTIKNKEVIKNLITRVYSGITNIPEIRKVKSEHEYYFEMNIHASADEKKKIEEKLKAKVVDEKEKSRTSLNSTLEKLKNKYNDLIKQNFNKFVRETDNSIEITKNSFIKEQSKWKQSPIFVINGTNQPAYKVQFERFNEMFQANFSTAYQFIKGIADQLQFNFYDDPYGTIHFSIPDMTLLHLYKNEKDSEIGTDPNVLTQITSFSQTQNTESIANIQCSRASYFYDLPMDMINECVKDYDSIAKYGERMMQILEIPGIINPKAMKYASKQMMNKYNRKALANIRIQMQGEPDLKMDKYAYMKELRKLFYIESYSHSYQTGGNFTTSLNGTYLRDILALADSIAIGKVAIVDGLNKDGTFKTVASESLLSNKYMNESSYLNKINNTPLTNFNHQIALTNSVKDSLNKIDNSLNFNLSLPELQQLIYNIYITNHGYPKNQTGLQNELAGIYNSIDIIKNCFLDGFFWELPFDINPYQIAKQIEEEEKIKLNAQKANIKQKQNSRNNILQRNILLSELKKLENKKPKVSIPEVTTKLEWQAGDFLPHFRSYKTYKIPVDFKYKGIDWIDMLKTAAKNT